ncbi:MAG: glycosyltransferase [Candidatus Methylomirabilales bacterium]
MRVSVLTATSAWGGAEVHTAALARTLAARGHLVTIHQLGHDWYDRGRCEPGPGVRLARVALPAPLPALGVLDCLRLLRGLAGDLGLLPKGTFEVGTWQLDLAARLAFPRFVSIEHLACPPMPARSRRRHLGGLLPGAGLWWHRLFLARRLRGAAPHRIVCVSEAVRTGLAREYDFPLHKMRTVRNGIDLDRFRASTEQARATRRAWGVPAGALVFGAVGRLHPQKGYDLALEAFARLRRRLAGRDLRLVLVGEGPLREELLAAAARAGLGDAFRLLEFTDRPWEAYPAFDFFLMPSRAEGLPLALLEAMACGAPPIATRAGGVPEVLARPDLGWLVEVDDRAGFFQAMRAAAELSPDDRGRMAEAARRHVAAHFNAARQFALLADLLERERYPRPGTMRAVPSEVSRA